MLCPTKLGPTGTQALNVELQNLLNPEQKGKPQLQSAARVFRVGDKVMQVRNNYEIVWQRIGGEQGVGAYNGDIGIVESINTRERSMVVRMDDRRLVYPAENLNELEIAYAITVHKSQGSEFPAVILPVAQVPPRLCYRNLFYTGVTRARKLCIVAGRRDVANRMMSNVRQNLRYSGLCALLQAELPPEQVEAGSKTPSVIACAMPAPSERGPLTERQGEKAPSPRELSAKQTEGVERAKLVYFLPQLCYTRTLI